LPRPSRPANTCRHASPARQAAARVAAGGAAGALDDPQGRAPADLGREVEAVDEAEAIAKAAEQLGLLPAKLIATRRGEATNLASLISC